MKEKKMKIDLSEKVIIITGASSGIGNYLARKFCEEKCKLVVCYNKNVDEAMKLESYLKNKGCKYMLLRVDIKISREVVIMMGKVVKKFGKIDVLINNAGIILDNTLLEMSDKQWDSVISTNLTGTFICCRECAKIMRTQNFGKIINISSLKGQIGSEFQANYCSSKAGVIGLTKSMAKELCVFGITVNSVCPGFIETNLNMGMETKKERATSESLLDIKNNLDSLSCMLAFLSSNLSNGVTGQVFNVDSRLI